MKGTLCGRKDLYSAAAPTGIPRVSEAGEGTVQPSRAGEPARPPRKFVNHAGMPSTASSPGGPPAASAQMSSASSRARAVQRNTARPAAEVNCAARSAIRSTISSARRMFGDAPSPEAAAPLPLRPRRGPGRRPPPDRRVSIVLRSCHGSCRFNARAVSPWRTSVWGGAGKARVPRRTGAVRHPFPHAGLAAFGGGNPGRGKPRPRRERESGTGSGRSRSRSSRVCPGGGGFSGGGGGFGRRLAGGSGGALGAPRHRLAGGRHAVAGGQHAADRVDQALAQGARTFGELTAAVTATATATSGSRRSSHPINHLRVRSRLPSPRPARGRQISPVDGIALAVLLRGLDQSINCSASSPGGNTGIQAVVVGDG